MQHLRPENRTSQIVNPHFWKPPFVKKESYAKKKLRKKESCAKRKSQFASRSPKMPRHAKKAALCATRVSKVYGVASVGLLAAGAGAAAAISGALHLNSLWHLSTTVSLVGLLCTQQSKWILPRVAALGILSLGFGVCLGAHVGFATEHVGMCDGIPEDVCITAQYLLLGASMLSGGIVYGLFALAGLLVPDNSPQLHWAKAILCGLSTVCILSVVGVWLGIVSAKMRFEVMFLQFGLVSACMTTFVDNAELVRAAMDARADIMCLAADVVINYICVTARIAYYVARHLGPLIVSIAKGVHKDSNKSSKEVE